MTIPDDLDIDARGLWGGLVILGNARINKAVNAAGDAATPKYEVYEGLEDIEINGQNVHRFGGTDDDDNSGVLRYVSIRHGGQKLSPDKEINGLSLGGVGRGTTIEYVEAVSFADDGFEFFGGTVNTKYLVSAFNDDDAFDTDMGWSGKNQFWFAIQSNDRRDNGSEQNGEPNERNDGTGVPAATYEIYNATLVGAGSAGGGTANNHAMLFRRYNQAGWYNSDLHGLQRRNRWNGGGPRHDGAAPEVDGQPVVGFRHGPVFTNDDLFTVAANYNNADQPHRRSAAARHQPHADDGATLDPRPLAGSPALMPPSGRRPSDGFLKPSIHVGAFDPKGTGCVDWTFLARAASFPAWSATK